LSVVPGREPERPEPSQYLTEEQAEIWREVTAAMPADWFRSETLPLLRPANDVAIANWSQPLSRGSFEPLRKYASVRMSLIIQFQKPEVRERIMEGLVKAPTVRKG
jgi:hypothetical protein